MSILVDEVVVVGVTEVVVVVVNVTEVVTIMPVVVKLAIGVVVLTP
jgi:hypothetical protein